MCTKNLGSMIVPSIPIIRTEVGGCPCSLSKASRLNTRLGGCGSFFRAKVHVSGETLKSIIGLWKLINERFHVQRAYDVCVPCLDKIVKAENVSRARSACVGSNTERRASPWQWRRGIMYGSCIWYDVCEDSDRIIVQLNSGLSCQWVQIELYARGRLVSRRTKHSNDCAYVWGKLINTGPTILMHMQ